MPDPDERTASTAPVSGRSPDPSEFDPGTDGPDEDVERRAAFARTLASHGYDDVLVLARERAAVVLHERRLRILDHLADHDPASVRALAAELDLDKGVVSRDLQELAGIDVVEYVESGRSKAPRLKHEHVVVEPVV